MSAFASHQLKQKDVYPFCRNPLDYFYKGNLANHTHNLDTFTNDLIREAEEVEPSWEPKDKATNFGYQTENTVFDAGENFTLLYKILEKEIHVYQKKISSETDYFIKFWPPNYILKGWYVRLIKGGYQDPHIHPSGWLSGVVYLKTIQSANSNEGAIELGLHGYDLPIINENYPRKIYRPQKGDIILFPSSLFHRTIPIETEADRCVVAFDLYPVKI